MRSMRSSPNPRSRHGLPTSVNLLVGSPADFGKFIAAETEKWGKVVEVPDIKPEVN